MQRSMRQDTFDLRDQIVSDDLSHHVQLHPDNSYPSDEEHSVLEDDSDTEDRDDYMDDDDGSSSLSIPNESIDFDMVYALHSFAATVEGQANVVKGDSLYLMDDSNSYWWLVRVLKTQEVGYIPAENIETPFERLARLNKHRNVDLASATQAEKQEIRDHILSSRAGSNQATPSPTPGNGVRPGSRNRSRQGKGVAFTPSFSVHRYPPAVWGDEEEEEEDVEWDDEGYEDEDPELAEEQEQERERAMAEGSGLPLGMEPDDGMSWEDAAIEDLQSRSRQGVITSGPEGEAETHQGPAHHTQQQPPVHSQEEAHGQEQPMMISSIAQSQGPQQVLRKQSSRERVTIVPDAPASSSPTAPKTMDPFQATETRKISITPPVARDQVQPQSGPLLPSAILQQQEEDRKRTREEIGALEDAARKKVNKGKGPMGSVQDQPKVSGGAKLRKERDREPTSTDEEGSKDKKKKSGVFGGLFGRRKDKGKDKSFTGSESGSTIGGGGSSDAIVSRGSEESGRSSNQQHTSAVSQTDPSSPVTANARQQQQAIAQQQQSQGFKSTSESSQSQSTQQQQMQTPQPSTVQQPQTQDTPPQSTIQNHLAQHASQLRQRDQQQQALYQQYLNRSPSSPPEAQPSYGLQSASAVMPNPLSFNSSSSSVSGLAVNTPRPRPGSLVLSPTAMDGQGVGVPDLSVVRVFAGHNLQTEATFKTALLNSSTTASGLVRQAIQRFRLSSGESENEYYLTIKQVEGSSAALLPQEKPLGVFESLVEAAMELPKVKRSSVGSISSVASNLSMHPAIRKLSMNDFTDDSQVKFYLNRRGSTRDESLVVDDGDETLLAESTHDDELEPPRSPGQYPLVTSGNSGGVTPERFSSPSYKFALQLAIHPEDLPDDMIFDPLTEAIVFKHTLRDRHSSTASSSSGVSQVQRKKIFVFPKNVTVAEVIELSLERFGILDGVVDGGDEVEDKLTKHRSSSRVRYGLAVDAGGRERELSPSSKVIDAFPRAPAFRTVERRTDNKRRSVDSAQLLLGSAEDIGPDDPTFILRRAVAYRTSSKHRTSAPLDEIALQHLHRDSAGSSISGGSDTTAGLVEEPKRQLSKQEIIAAQRAATRANQKAILSAQTNSARGLDVLLPGNAMIRSSRYEVDDRMRYSYVEPDGETYDISDIVEEEWRSEAGPLKERADTTRDDLLHGVLSRGKDGLGARLDRVLSKIRQEKVSGRTPVSQAASGFDTHMSVRSTSPSVYSTAEGGNEVSNSRSATPNANMLNARSSTPTASLLSTGQRVTSPVSRLSSYRTASPGDSAGRSTPHTTSAYSSRNKVSRPPHDRQQSMVSVTSDSSGYHSFSPGTPPASARSRSGPNQDRQRLYLPKDDFGVAHMMAIIGLRGKLRHEPALSPLDPVDELLFGREIDVNGLHPQIREIYSDTFKQLEEMDNALDDLLSHVAHAF